MRRIFPLGLMAAVTALAGCETMQGAGRDMQTAGVVLTEQSANAQTQMGGYPPTAGGGAPVAVTPQPY